MLSGELSLDAFPSLLPMPDQVRMYCYVPGTTVHLVLLFLCQYQFFRYSRYSSRYLDQSQTGRQLKVGHWYHMYRCDLGMVKVCGGSYGVMGMALARYTSVNVNAYLPGG